MDEGGIVPNNQAEIKPIKIIYAEKNLESIGFFSLTKGRGGPGKKSKTVLKDLPAKEVQLSSQGNIERFYIIIPDSELGFPDTLDLEFYRGIQILIDEYMREHDGEPPLKISFRPNQLLKTIHKCPGKWQYQLMADFVRKLKTVTIESKNVLYTKEEAKKGYFVAKAVSVCDEVCRVGETHPETKEKSRVHFLKFSDWYYNNILRYYVKPIDIDLYLSLEKPVAKHLYGIFDVMLYAGKGVAHKRYEDLCNVIGLIPREHPSHIKRQLDPALKELKDSKYLSEYVLPESKDGVLKVTAGDRFFRVLETQEQKKYYVLKDSDLASKVQAVVEIDLRQTKSGVPQGALSSGQDEKKVSVASHQEAEDLPQEAMEIVRYFHKKFRNIDDHEPLRSEIKVAKELIQKYGKEGAYIFVECAISEMKKTKFYDAKTLNAILVYEKQCEQKYKQELERREQEKSGIEQEKKLTQIIQQFMNYKNSPAGKNVFQIFTQRMNNECYSKLTFYVDESKKVREVEKFFILAYIKKFFPSLTREEIRRLLERQGASDSDPTLSYNFLSKYLPDFLDIFDASPSAS